MSPSKLFVPIGAAVAFVAFGCGHSTPDATTPRASSASPSAVELQASQDTRMTDGHVLAVVRTIAATDIEQARLARDMASFAKVRQYADRIAFEHGDVNAKADHVSQKASLSPRPSATSNAFDAEGKQDTLDLGSKRGEAFDRTYLGAQIRSHEAALETIDAKLLPSVRSPELRALVEAVRSNLARQLVEARDLLGKLDGE